MKFPRSVYNWVSISGAFIALFNLFLIVLLFVLSTIFNLGGSYLGLFIYIVLPGIMIVGLLMIPIGMLAMKARLKGTTAKGTLRSLVVDMGISRHRNAVMVFTICTILLLFLSSIGSYEAFHYTESVEFCGKLCHRVMQPEYVTYQNSPHARVACVDCHVGAGTDWYVRSKISGLRQVYAVASNHYSRPIPTPLHNLRPARETCEKCHWPQKFYARKSYTQKSFLTDSLNTEWDITLLMKTGPEYSALGLEEGIHWHINPNVKVEYIAASDSREMIPWVKYTNLLTGEEHIYQDEENPLDDSTLAALPMRTMDCLDCHNRPSHIYKSPPDYIDEAMIAGDIPKEIPYIKYIAMQVLIDPFEDKDTAMNYIETEVLNFYETEHPDYFSANKELIQKAITGIQQAYSLNAFPSMRVRYDAYPDHIGHLESPGCFRCHSGTHKTEEGRVISKDCNLCHSIVEQGVPGNMTSVPLTDSLEFQHPVYVKGKWKQTCADCHTYLY